MKETVLGLNKDMKFYFCPEYVNMQKGIDSLCVHIPEHTRSLSGSL